MRRLGGGTGGHEGGSGGRARYSEELKRRIRLVVARVRRRALAIGEALPCEEAGRIGYIGTARNVHDAVLVFGQQAEPTRLMMTDVALLLQPLQAGIVGVQLEGLIEKVGSQGLERVHHSQQLEQLTFATKTYYESTRSAEAE